jgi:hypothetical protein
MAKMYNNLFKFEIGILHKDEVILKISNWLQGRAVDCFVCAQ